jgi:hypothetical protein
MIVTNGIKVLDTDYMIKIDQRENATSWSVLEKILFAEEEDEYYYFCKTTYNAPNNIIFRNTYADSLTELDEVKEDEFFINDYLGQFEWDNIDDDESIDPLKCDLLFDANDLEKKISFEIRVAPKGFYLIYQTEHEPLTYTFVNELPVEFILKYCYFKQRFEDLVYLLKYIPQDYRDESVEDRKYNYLYDSEMAMIWGVTRQNFSKTYSNPIESQKRLRKRQKIIIELGCTALKYGLNEKQILDFAKSLKK